MKKLIRAINVWVKATITEEKALHWAIAAYVLAVAITLICISGCTTTKYIEVEKTKTIKEVVRDTAIVMEADTAMMQALLECDSLGNVYITEIETLRKSSDMETTVKIERDTLHIFTKRDTITEYVSIKDSYYTEVDTIIKVVERELSRWEKFRINIGNAVLVLVGIALVYIILKAYMKK